jgi:hypothetical protein
LKDIFSIAKQLTKEALDQDRYRFTIIEKGKLSHKIKLLFSTADLSTSIPLAIIMFFQLYFLTDVVVLRPDYAGWSVGISRIWVLQTFGEPLKINFGKNKFLPYAEELNFVLQRLEGVPIR